MRKTKIQMESKTTIKLAKGNSKTPIGNLSAWTLPALFVAVFGFVSPALAATTLSESDPNELYVTSDETYSYLFSSSTDTTYIVSNTAPTNFPTTPGDTCALYGDDTYRVVSVDSYTVCNVDIRSLCEADTGATTADFECVAGDLVIGGGGPTCGDGVIETPEVCDDGNTANADGCSDVCEVETGWECVDEPSVCTEIPPSFERTWIEADPWERGVVMFQMHVYILSLALGVALGKYV